MNEEKLYRVLEIYEADFGCEERPEGQETMVMVRLAQMAQKTQEIQDCEKSDRREDKRKEEQAECTIQVADSWLEAHNIAEGDLVCLSEGKPVPSGTETYPERKICPDSQTHPEVMPEEAER